MRTHRFYSSQTFVVGKTVELLKPASHHCLQVLRYQINDPIIVFNGDGNDYLGHIADIKGKNAIVKIDQLQTLSNESPLKIHLYQSLAKGDKMEWVIQKSVELGVSQITPIISERSNVKLDEKRQQKKLAQWQGIIQSACEQCGRAVLPQLNSMININQISNTDNTQLIYLEPKSNLSINSLNKSTQSVKLFIGPEGGLSDHDIQTLKAIGAHGVNLGKRILRTETAAIATQSIFQAKFGDL